MNAVARNLQRNVALGIRMAIIDGVFSLLSNADSEDLLNRIKKMGLNQVVILESLMKPALEGQTSTFLST